jgi:hypothetical protein
MKTLREAYGAETKFTQSLAKDIDSLNKINELVGLPNVARAVNELSIPGGSIDVVGYTVKGEAIVYEHQDLSGRADQTHVGKTSHYARVLKSQGLKVLGTILLCESIDKIFLDTFEDIRWAYNRRPTLMGHCNIHAVRSIWTDELTYAPELFTDDTIIRGSDTVLDFYKQFVSIYAAEWTIQREESNGSAITLWHRPAELDARYMMYVHTLKNSVNVGIHCLKGVKEADEQLLSSIDVEGFEYRRSRDRATVERKFPRNSDSETWADSTEKLKRSIRNRLTSA